MSTRVFVCHDDRDSCNVLHVELHDARHCHVGTVAELVAGESVQVHVGPGQRVVVFEVAELPAQAETRAA